MSPALAEFEAEFSHQFRTARREVYPILSFAVDRQESMRSSDDLLDFLGSEDHRDYDVASGDHVGGVLAPTGASLDKEVAGVLF